MMRIREAQPKDSGLILALIRAIAKYEKLEHMVTATEEDIHRTLFEEDYASAVLAEEDGTTAGFALFYYNYSTFQGKPGIHLEDIFVYPEFRGKGYGKALFRHVAEIAVKKGCGRMEWTCLNWNENAKGFYKSMGAQPLEDWTVFRLSGTALNQAAGESGQN